MIGAAVRGLGAPLTVPPLVSTRAGAGPVAVVNPAAWADAVARMVVPASIAAPSVRERAVLEVGFMVVSCWAFAGRRSPELSP